MNELPTMNAKPPEFKSPDLTQTTTVAITPNCEVISITVPYVATPPEAAGHQDEARRVDMGTLTRERMRKIKALRRGYVASDTRMENGSEVRTNRDALFCLLDQLDI